MSYIKLGQISNNSSELKNIGNIYIETQYKEIIVAKNIIFPLEVIVEVIDWENQEEQQKQGKIILQVSEIIVVPDTSLSIRQSVFNQLQGKYPGLVM